VPEPTTKKATLFKKQEISIRFININPFDERKLKGVFGYFSKKRGL